ncbi:replication-associated recombination protein A [Solirubrobacter ginsenosidimutans]|uniref:Replication-associated recombination protein A n=1 Tax=Solirubrobacter ginsenosidimutans TaxID=490573 RepID=A0A9X3SA16_9ACTN|nr:replication-associated recombination protein A [Solirubrobacter ginsenosidimutans]MDA0165523.1 replication-associated recombination protein A [Solirubrobacter ginsenosidimutans]
MGRLFDVPDEPAGRSEPPAGDLPLAARMRPRTLEEFVGQTHLLGPSSALRTAIQSGEPHSMILYGPPGTGKTTLARMSAEYADAAFEELSAVEAGRAEVREVIARARERRRNGRHTIFFLDEIHRFNKAQQDALLPAVEEGLVVLVGATTENPYFEVNSALISRAQVYELHELTQDDIAGLLRRALDELGRTVSDEVIDFIAGRSGGDARSSLNALELALDTSARTGQEVTLADAEDAMQRKAVRYDKGGDQHYDYISAWIKSTRGSDPDASLYYLAAMLEGGEDARYIARRMIILASEDIGNAAPQALQVAVAAAHAVEHVGLPEAHFALAQAAVYLALAPKSNAAGMALSAARAYIREHGAALPPSALRDAHYPGAKSLGRGKGYDYPHDHPGNVNDQEHLPEGLEGLRFYDPGDTEPTMRERLNAARSARRRDA